MSLFDPYSLYNRKYRKTRKGQVIRQKPTDYQTPFTKDEIPRSISVLKTFGYYVSSHLHQPRYFTMPFILFNSGLSLTSLDISVNSLWPLLQARYSTFSNFIENNSNYETSNIGIYITSATLLYQVGNAQIQFYNNNVITISKLFNLNGDISHFVSVSFSPAELTSYFFSYDSAFQLTAANGESSVENRIVQNVYDGNLCYTQLNADWEEINSSSGLATDIKLLDSQQQSGTTLIKTYFINGYITIHLNSY